MTTVWCTFPWCRISEPSTASYFSVKQKHRVVVELYPGDVSIFVYPIRQPGHGKIEPADFFGNLNVFSKKKALKPTTVLGTKHHKNPSCQFYFISPTLVAMDPFSHEPTPQKPTLRILTPPMETPDPPSDTPGASIEVFLTLDIPRILKAAKTPGCLMVVQLVSHSHYWHGSNCGRSCYPQSPCRIFFWQLHTLANWDLNFQSHGRKLEGNIIYSVFNSRNYRISAYSFSIYTWNPILTFLFECQPFKTRPKFQSKQPGHLFPAPEVFFVGFSNGEVTLDRYAEMATGSCERKCVCISVSTTPGIIEPAKKGQNNASWWFQPIWNILVKLDHLSR